LWYASFSIALECSIAKRTNEDVAFAMVLIDADADENIVKFPENCYKLS
jgi:hypothetical protein